RAGQNRDRGDGQAPAQLLQVLTERHPLVLLVAPTPRPGRAGAGGHAHYGLEVGFFVDDFGDVFEVDVSASGSSASASSSAASSFFMVLTSLRKIRIDCPMLRARPGSFGAPKSSRMTSTMTMMCQPWRAFPNMRLIIPA